MRCLSVWRPHPVIQLDRAFESMFNVFFYLVVLFIVVAAIGLDPLVLFGSVSGFVLGFAFMIGKLLMYISSV